MINRIGIILLVPPLLAIGCGGSDGKLEVYPTGGMLMLDGEPFGPTTLRLIPVGEGGHSVVGKADESGMTTFTTYQIGDGAPAGDYTVVIGLEMAAPPKPFPKVYQDPSKSPLKTTVVAGEMNNLILDMDPSVGGAMYSGPSFRGPDMNSAYESDAFSAGASKDD
jgi:hypothetical protein